MGGGHYLGYFKIGQSSLHIFGLLILPGSEEFLVWRLSGALPGSRIKSLRRRLRPVMEGLVEVWRNF